LIYHLIIYTAPYAEFIHNQTPAIDNVTLSLHDALPISSSWFAARPTRTTSAAWWPPSGSSPHGAGRPRTRPSWLAAWAARAWWARTPSTWTTARAWCAWAPGP